MSTEIFEPITASVPDSDLSSDPASVVSIKGRVSLINLGCAKNEVDSEEMLGLLQGEGYGVESAHNSRAVASDTDVVIINTCGFIEAAKEESINTILEALQRKKRGEVKRVVVAGCLVQRYGKELAAEMKDVDAFIGTGQIGSIGQVVERSLIRTDQLLEVAAKPHHRWLDVPAKIKEKAKYMKCSLYIELKFIDLQQPVVQRLDCI